LVRQATRPIFEAGFRTEGTLAFVDVLLPVKKGGRQAWRMVEVKSSTSVKDYHRDDAAVQAFIVRSANIHKVGSSAITLQRSEKLWDSLFVLQERKVS
jgi:hypothetical protein